LRIGQLFYGSLSGERNFRILADSGDLSRDERDVVRHYSNLGGSAQTAESPEPVWTAYPLSRGRRAFSRTVFLGAGGRGNDYLAHVLVLDADTLAWLRGDLFLLAELDLFAAEKPAEDEPLAPLTLDRGRLERASARRIGADAAFPLADVADLVRALADGPVALAAGRAGAGTDLCRTVLSALPPDDRRRLAFCSRFSHPRRAAFHLAVHQPEDASLVEDGLVGFDRRRNELAPAAGPGPFQSWLARAADDAAALEPLTGLSLLGRPEEAVATVAALDEWLAALPAEPAEAAPGIDLHRRGDPIVQRAQSRGLPLLEVARHPLNRRLPATGRLLLEAAVHSLVQRVGRALADGEDPFVEAADACAATAEGTRPGALLARLIGMAREAADQEAAERSAGAAEGASGKRGARWSQAVKQPANQPGETATRAYTAAACALAVGGAGGARAIYSRLGEDALWRKPAEVARDLGAIAATSPRAFLDLATTWFAAWRELEGAAGALDEIGPLLGRLAEAPEPALNLALRALEQAAPGAGAAAGADGGERRAWYLALIRRLRADLGAAYPTLTAARLAVEERLLDELNEAEVEELTPAMVESFPGHLERRLEEGLEEGGLPWPVLRRALFVSTAGLLPRRYGGRDWDVDWQEGERLDRWPLAARVAASAATGAAGRGDRAALAEVAWLVWAATRLAATGAGDPLAGGDALDLLAEALDTLIEAHPTGGGGGGSTGSTGSTGNAATIPEPDIALRALWRLRRLRRAEPRAGAAALAALRDAALAAAPLGADRGDAATFAAATRARVAHLADEGLFPPPGAEAAP